MPALIEAVEKCPKSKKINVDYFYRLLFTRHNLKLVHIVCHDKQVHCNKKCDTHSIYRPKWNLRNWFCTLARVRCTCKEPWDIVRHDKQVNCNKKCLRTPSVAKVRVAKLIRTLARVRCECLRNSETLCVTISKFMHCDKKCDTNLIYSRKLKNSDRVSCNWL